MDIDSFTKKEGIWKEIINFGAIKWRWIMETIIEIPKMQVVMAFVSTCIEATARTLGVSYKEVYDRMNKVNMIDEYIYPCYETLHTESRENIVNDLINCLKNWEAKAWKIWLCIMELRW